MYPEKGLTVQILPTVKTVEGEDLDFFTATNVDTGQVLENLTPEDLGKLGKFFETQGV